MRVTDGPIFIMLSPVPLAAAQSANRRNKSAAVTDKSEGLPICLFVY
jgi:hypothetical protein